MVGVLPAVDDSMSETHAMKVVKGIVFMVALLDCDSSGVHSTLELSPLRWSLEVQNTIKSDGLSQRI